MSEELKAKAALKAEDLKIKAEAYADAELAAMLKDVPELQAWPDDLKSILHSTMLGSYVDGFGEAGYLSALSKTEKGEPVGAKTINHFTLKNKNYETTTIKRKACNKSVRHMVWRESLR